MLNSFERVTFFFILNLWLRNLQYNVLISVSHHLEQIYRTGFFLRALTFFIMRYVLIFKKSHSNAVRPSNIRNHGWVKSKLCQKISLSEIRVLRGWVFHDPCCILPKEFSDALSLQANLFGTCAEWLTALLCQH